MRNNNLTAYVANRDLMRTGDKIEFRAKTILGWGIRWFTKQNVNHTAMVVCLAAHKYKATYHVYILEAVGDGIELNLLSDVLQKYDGQAWWAKLNATDEQRNKMADWALEIEGTGYDWKSLFKNMAGKVSTEINRLFCSEFLFVACVVGKLIKGLRLDSIKQCVVDEDNKIVSAPRPGEFGVYKIFGEEIQVI